MPTFEEHLEAILMKVSTQTVEEFVAILEDRLERALDEATVTYVSPICIVCRKERPSLMRVSKQGVRIAACDKCAEEEGLDRYRGRERSLNPKERG